MIKQYFSGTASLTRFILRRDRVRLILWIVLLSFFCVGLVPVFSEVIFKGAEKTAIIEMMKNPAIIAMIGPMYGEANYTIGAAYANYMLVFSVMIAGAMNIFLISRHTRADEEMGRLEVIRSLPVGRLSNLASALVTALIANTFLTLLTTLGLYLFRAEGMDLLGCFVFGASLGVIGLFFAALTAVFCQLTANNRTAMGLSFLSLFLLYMMRAVGDTGNETLSLISPLGLVLRTQNFVENKFWPLIVIKLISFGLILLAFVLSWSRDLGSGLLPQKAGKKHASGLLSSPTGLALRLIRTAMIIWIITVFSFAAMYGSVFGDLEGYIKASDMLRAIFSLDGGSSLTLQFVVLLVAIMAMISTIPLLNFTLRVVGEEKDGVAEHILSKAVSRPKQMMAYLLPTLVLSVILQLLSAYGFWVVGSSVLEATPPLETFINASLLYLPAMWLLVGIATLLIGYLPRKTFLAYLYLAYIFFSIYFGRLMDLPDWVKKLSPFGYIPQYPLEEISVLPLVLLVAVSIALMILGTRAYRNRDMMTQ